ncbi:beta-ketoacyl-[acyl-carrier-protein] synthase family protein [Streptomyces cuspidosporus]|uniref:Beta-ketoacyl-[acyl-carrier-protein] synthase family protein n=1 Tax=Streptomyces cuspidosporus TaxID=66882 RepID=A0ABP5TA71_9ACTN
MSRPDGSGEGRESPRDAVVTGLGFCLPGEGGPSFTAGQVWNVASRGGCCLGRDGTYYGSVDLTDEMFAERVPGIPEFFSRQFTDAHRFGLVSLVEACADGELDIEAGDLRDAALLVGRGGIDSNVNSYLAASRADPEHTGPLDALELFIAVGQSAIPSDVALVQGTLTRTTGPCFTVACGCASAGVQIGHAQRLIAAGEIDLAAVTGVDVFDSEVVGRAERLLESARRAYAAKGGEPGALGPTPSSGSLMRPYDRRSDCINYGEGAATVIVESREHAQRRGAHIYGQVLATALTRDGLANPLGADDSGAQLVNAVRRCLGERWRIEQVPYIHSCGDGDPAVTAVEANAVRTLYGATAGPVLVTSQDACFGHHGAPAGCLGVGLTLMMMEQGAVCPTANCEQPMEGLPFDPVPGTRARPLHFDHALCFSYQTGGVKHAMLLGGPGVT